MIVFAILFLMLVSKTYEEFTPQYGMIYGLLILLALQDYYVGCFATFWVYVMLVMSYLSDL